MFLAVRLGEVTYSGAEDLIIALSGSFEVAIDDGESKYAYSLNRSYYVLFKPAGFWRQMENFSTNSQA